MSTDSDAQLYGGVETGGTWCVCALGSGPDSIIARTRLRTGAPEQTLGEIVDFFRQHPKPKAIGVGSFGPADVNPKSPHWGEVTTTPKPGWGDVSVAPVLERELAVPVSFDTDVAAAAVGEARWGAGQGAQSLCYMTVGTGVGVGLLLDGRPWHGIVHPEVGHMRIPHDPALDPFPGVCPYHGDCLEGLASGPAIAARWGVPAQELEADHPAWELEAGYLAAALTNIVFSVGPERIVVGGGVLEHPGLLELVRDRVERMLGSYLRTPVLGPGLHSYLIGPALGDDAGVLGAISMAQNQLGLRARTAAVEGPERDAIPELEG